VHIAHLPEIDAKVSKIGFRLQGDDFDDVQHQVLIKS
jgi:hypothetical protein